MKSFRCRTRCAVLLAGTVVLGIAASVEAATFSVTTIDDSGAGSLRQAIINANAAGGTNTIAFAIPGAGPHTITLASLLPPVSAQTNLTIDGYSQPGSAMNTNAPDQGGLDTVLMIEVTGGTNNISLGFHVAGGPCCTTLTVQGLALNRLGIPIAGNGGSAGVSIVNVYGNFIGTTLDGTALPGLGNNDCVRTGLGSASIGGPQAWQRNLLSGNGGAGVLISGGPTTVEGNLIGTDASGTLAIPNGTATNWPGIYVGTNQPDIRIGCSAAGCASAASRNVISGNITWGIGLWGASPYTGLEIKGNYIGTDWTGTRPLPNGTLCTTPSIFCGGIQLQGGSNDAAPALIGGFEPGEENLIAYNNGAGIAAYANSPGASFDSRANRLHHNRGVGGANIDIGAAGLTPNDTDDADSGANDQQNWPVILSASQAGNQLTVTYRVDSTVANAAYPLRIDFHADARGGSGAWLTQDSYPAASAQQTRTTTLLMPQGTAAIPFVATATNADGHTSELSPAFDVIFEDDFD